MHLHTRFTQAFGLTTPIALAPMALSSGGALSAACAHAGALGLLGGGYGDLAWTLREHHLALQALSGQPEALARLGCGFITWRLDQDASALDAMLDQAHRPAAIMLSFGDPRPYRARLQAAGVPLMCQVQSLAQIPWAIEAGAAVLVVSVIQRSKEIGILRAMGTTRGQIIRLFLLQGGLLGFAGSMVGAVLGAGGLVYWHSVARQADGGELFPLMLEQQLFVYTAILATLTGLLAAMAPALRAAKLDPVVAIRG